MSTTHGDEPGTRKAYHNTDIIDTALTKLLAFNGTKTPSQEEENKENMNKIYKLCGKFNKKPDFFWEIEKNAKNGPTGWVKKKKK